MFCVKTTLAPIFANTGTLKYKLTINELPNIPLIMLLKSKCWSFVIDTIGDKSPVVANPPIKLESCASVRVAGEPFLKLLKIEVRFAAVVSIGLITVSELITELEY